MYIYIYAHMHTLGPTMHAHEQILSYFHAQLQIMPRHNYISTTIYYAGRNKNTIFNMHSKTCVPTLLSALQTRR